VSEQKASKAMTSCPFCGREHPRTVIDYQGGEHFYLECQRCFARGPRTVASEGKATELWDKRAAVEPPCEQPVEGVVRGSSLEQQIALARGAIANWPADVRLAMGIDPEASPRTFCREHGVFFTTEACPKCTAQPPTGGLSCSGCREWIAANAPGGWIDDLRKRAVDMQNSLDTQEKIHCDFVAAYSAHEPADSRGVGLAETDWNRALSGNFHALDPQHQPVFDKLARLAEPPADRLQFFFDWMTTPNPNFGNAVPLSMLEAGLGHKVAQFIRHAIEDEAAVTKSVCDGCNAVQSTATSGERDE
jgi:hypothetical protein